MLNYFTFLPFCSPCHSCLWSLFCILLMTCPLCFKMSASFMEDIKCASTTSLLSQCNNSSSGKFCKSRKYNLLLYACIHSSHFKCDDLSALALDKGRCSCPSTSLSPSLPPPSLASEFYIFKHPTVMWRRGEGQENIPKLLPV